MQTVSQMMERYGHQQTRTRVRQAMQPGSVKAIIDQELNSVLSDALNAQMKAEQEAILGRSPYQRIPGSPSRNGYKVSKVAGLFGSLLLRRPVVRKGTMISPLLTALKEAGTKLRDVLAIRFWLRGASTRAAAQEINNALGTKLSRSTVSTLSNGLEPVLREWETRRIPEGICYLFLDALYLPVRRPGFTREQAILMALGVDSKGKRHILGFLLGDRESTESWTALLKDLIKRGLKRKNLKLVLSDEHKGIEAAVAKLLAIPHQLCLVHKLRNLKSRIAAPDWKEFLADLHQIFWVSSRERARQCRGRREAKWQSRYPKAVSLTVDRFEDFTRFFDEPEKFWTLLRSTNLIERFILEMRRRLRPAGTMHSELEVTKLIWSVATEQEKRWHGKTWKPRGTLRLQEAMA